MMELYWTPEAIDLSLYQVLSRIKYPIQLGKGRRRITNSLEKTTHFERSAGGMRSFSSKMEPASASE